MIRRFHSFALSMLAIVVLATGSSSAQASKSVKTNAPFGTPNFLPVWTGPGTIQSSNVFQSSTGQIGIGTNTPASTLDVNGGGNFSGSLSASSYLLGGSLFAYGSFNLGNAFFGFSANTSLTGANNTAIGQGALLSDTSGSSNTATGLNALGHNTTGGGNTGTGWGALGFNTAGVGNTAMGNQSLAYVAGSFNTGLGGFAGTPTTVIATATGSGNTFLGNATTYGPTNLNNATAVGSYAEVDASNALVLGSIANVNGCGTEFTPCASTNVGIGTTAPTTTLQVAGGDISTTTAGNGLIVKSPDGSVCARIGIDNSGTIVATSIACP